MYCEELSQAAKTTPKGHAASTTVVVELSVVNSGVYIYKINDSDVA